MIPNVSETSVQTAVDVMPSAVQQLLTAPAFHITQVHSHCYHYLIHIFQIRHVRQHLTSIKFQKHCHWLLPRTLSLSQSSNLLCLSSHFFYRRRLLNEFRTISPGFESFSTKVFINVTLTVQISASASGNSPSNHSHKQIRQQKCVSRKRPRF